MGKRPRAVGERGKICESPSDRVASRGRVACGRSDTRGRAKDFEKLPPPWLISKAARAATGAAVFVFAQEAERGGDGDGVCSTRESADRQALQAVSSSERARESWLRSPSIAHSRTDLDDDGLSTLPLHNARDICSAVAVGTTLVCSGDAIDRAIAEVAEAVDEPWSEHRLVPGGSATACVGVFGEGGCRTPSRGRGAASAAAGRVGRAPSRRRNTVVSTGSELVAMVAPQVQDQQQKSVRGNDENVANREAKKGARRQQKDQLDGQRRATGSVHHAESCSSERSKKRQKSETEVPDDAKSVRVSGARDKDSVGSTSREDVPFTSMPACLSRMPLPIVPELVEIPGEPAPFGVLRAVSGDEFGAPLSSHAETASAPLQLTGRVSSDALQEALNPTSEKRSTSVRRENKQSTPPIGATVQKVASPGVTSVAQRWQGLSCSKTVGKGEGSHLQRRNEKTNIGAHQNEGRAVAHRSADPKSISCISTSQWVDRLVAALPTKNSDSAPKEATKQGGDPSMAISPNGTCSSEACIHRDVAEDCNHLCNQSGCEETRGARRQQSENCQTYHRGHSGARIEKRSRTPINKVFGGKAASVPEQASGRCGPDKTASQEAFVADRDHDHVILSDKTKPATASYSTQSSKENARCTPQRKVDDHRENVLQESVRVEGAQQRVARLRSEHRLTLEEVQASELAFDRAYAREQHDAQERHCRDEASAVACCNAALVVVRDTEVEGARAEASLLSVEQAVVAFSKTAELARQRRLSEVEQRAARVGSSARLNVECLKAKLHEAQIKLIAAQRDAREEVLEAQEAVECQRSRARELMTAQEEITHFLEVRQIDIGREIASVKENERAERAEFQSELHAEQVALDRRANECARRTSIVHFEAVEAQTAACIAEEEALVFERAAPLTRELGMATQRSSDSAQMFEQMKIALDAACSEAVHRARLREADVAEAAHSAVRDASAHLEFVQAASKLRLREARNHVTSAKKAAATEICSERSKCLEMQRDILHAEDRASRALASVKAEVADSVCHIATRVDTTWKSTAEELEHVRAEHDRQAFRSRTCAEEYTSLEREMERVEAVASTERTATQEARETLEHMERSRDLTSRSFAAEVAESTQRCEARVAVAREVLAASVEGTRVRHEQLQLAEVEADAREAEAETSVVAFRQLAEEAVARSKEKISRQVRVARAMAIERERAVADTHAIFMQGQHALMEYYSSVLSMNS